MTAELPAHFAESIANLGFDPALGDLPLDEVKYGETPEGKRRAATAAAKARRKERKGERRSRGPRLMHPDRRFAWQRSRRRCSPSSPTPPSARSSPPATTAPPSSTCRSSSGPDRLRFHVSRSNRGAAALDGARLLLSCAGPDAYVSPDWYGTPDQVPTWNYVAVEAEGPAAPARRGRAWPPCSTTLSADHEARLAPKPRLDPRQDEPGPVRGHAQGDHRLRAADRALRGTRKLGQNKNAARNGRRDRGPGSGRPRARSPS